MLYNTKSITALSFHNQDENKKKNDVIPSTSSRSRLLSIATKSQALLDKGQLSRKTWAWMMYLCIYNNKRESKMGFMKYSGHRWKKYVKLMRKWSLNLSISISWRQKVPVCDMSDLWNLKRKWSHTTQNKNILTSWDFNPWLLKQISCLTTY